MSTFLIKYHQLNPIQNFRTDYHLYWTIKFEHILVIIVILTQLPQCSRWLLSALCRTRVRVGRSHPSGLPLSQIPRECPAGCANPGLRAKTDISCTNSWIRLVWPPTRVYHWRTTNSAARGCVTLFDGGKIPHTLLALCAACAADMDRGT